MAPPASEWHFKPSDLYQAVRLQQVANPVSQAQVDGKKDRDLAVFGWCLSPGARLISTHGLAGEGDPDRRGAATWEFALPVPSRTAIDFVRVTIRAAFSPIPRHQGGSGALSAMRERPPWSRLGGALYPGAQAGTSAGRPVELTKVARLFRQSASALFSYLQSRFDLYTPLGVMVSLPVHGMPSTEKPMSGICTALCGATCPSCKCPLS